MSKKIIYILLLFQTLISCQQEPSISKTSFDPAITKTSFDYIDISFNNGINGIISVFIDSSKVIKVHTINHDKQNVYYQDTLKELDVIKINRLSNKALSDNIDTLFGSPSCFTLPYYLILVNKDKSIRTLVYQDIDYAFRPLDSLTNTIISLTNTIKQNALDTNFVFTSLKKVLGPPSPTPNKTVKFIPPVIKDN